MDIQKRTMPPTGMNDTLSADLKDKIVEKLGVSFDAYFEKLKQLDDKDFIKIYTDLLKMVVPPPSKTTESDNTQEQTLSVLRSRLFGKESS